MGISCGRRGDPVAEVTLHTVRLRLNHEWKQEGKGESCRTVNTVSLIGSYPSYCVTGMVQAWWSVSFVMGTLVAWSEPTWPVVSPHLPCRQLNSKLQTKKKQAGTGSNRLFIVQQRQVGWRHSQAANIDKQPEQDVVTKSKKQVNAIRSQHFDRCSGTNF